MTWTQGFSVLLWVLVWFEVLEVCHIWVSQRGRQR